MSFRKRSRLSSGWIRTNYELRRLAERYDDTMWRELSYARSPEPTAANGRARTECPLLVHYVLRRPQEARYAAVEEKSSNLLDCITGRSVGRRSALSSTACSLGADADSCVSKVVEGDHGLAGDRGS